MAALTIWMWWPAGLCYRSDDWLAVHWSRDLGNVLHDFAGPYQGAERIALFHRPLITASVWLDTRIAALLGDESASFFPLLMNLAAHLASGALLYCLLRRFSGVFAAGLSAAWWLLQPGHVEAVSWMIGRVDTHASVLVLAALLLEVRSFERARDGGAEAREGWPRAALLAFWAAAWTKETALVLPALVFLHAALRRGAGENGLLARVRRASWRTLPWAVLLLAVLAYRLLVLGEAIGGYAEGVFAPLRAFASFEALLVGAAPAWLLATIVGGALALRFALRRGAGAAALAFCVLATLVAALPTAGAAGDADARDERYRYLPSACLSGALALGGPVAPLALLASALPEALATRNELRAACARIEARLAELPGLIATRSGEDQPALLACDATEGGFRAFHVGVDRLGLEPFGAGNAIVLPDRALFPGLAQQRDEPAPGGAALRIVGGPLDEARFARMRDGEDAYLEIQARAGHAMRTQSVLVVFYTCFGRLHCQAPVLSHVGDTLRVSLRALLLGQPLGIPPPTTTLHNLWPGVEIAADGDPFVRVELRDTQNQRVDASGRLVRLEITRKLGHLLRAKRPGYLALLALLGIAALLFVLGRGGRSRLRTSAPRSS